LTRCATIITVLCLTGCIDAHKRATDGAMDARAAAEAAVKLSVEARENMVGTRQWIEAMTDEVGKADGHAQNVIVAIDGRKYEVARSEAETIRQRLGTARTAATEGHAAANRAMSLTEAATAQATAAGKSAGIVVGQLPALQNTRGILGQIWDFIRGFGILLIIVAVFAVLVYSGAGNLLRPLFAAAGLIPKGITEAATRLANRVANATASGTELDIDTVRLIEQQKNDPRFDAAFQKAYQKKLASVVQHGSAASVVSSAPQTQVEHERAIGD
jgi:hypothetical protein